MSRIALTFAVLDSGGTTADLGFVFAASVFPQVLVMLGGGVLADRVGRRPLMLVADAARLAVQATLAAALFIGRPSLWLFIALSALLAAGEGFFNPALGGLRAEMVPPANLPDANSVLSVAGSATTIAGPALAGVLIAFNLFTWAPYLLLGPILARQYLGGASAWGPAPMRLARPAGLRSDRSRA